MSVRIYQPVKNPMQSGKANTRHWVLEFNPEAPRFNDPIMGWVGSSDMKQELSLCFSTQEEAVAYAEQQGLDYKVIEPREPKLHLQSYADNFK